MMSLKDAFARLVKPDGRPDRQASKRIYDELLTTKVRGVKAVHREEIATTLLIRWVQNVPHRLSNPSATEDHCVATVKKSVRNAHRDILRAESSKRAREEPEVSVEALGDAELASVADDYGPEIYPERVHQEGLDVVNAVAEEMFERAGPKRRAGLERAWAEMKALFFTGELNRDTLIERWAEEKPDIPREKLRADLHKAHKVTREAYVKTARDMKEAGALTSEQLRMVEDIYETVLTSKPRSHLARVRKANAGDDCQKGRI